MAYVLVETISTTDTTRIAVSRFTSADWLAGRYAPASSYTLAQLGVGLVIGAGTPPSGLLTAHVWSDITGGSPSPNVNTLLASSTNTVNQNTVTSSVAEYLFQFSGVPLVSGTNYWFGVSSDTVDGSNYVSLVRGTFNASRYVNISGDGATWTLTSNGYLYLKTYEDDAPVGQPSSKRHGGVLHASGASPLGSRRW